MFTPERLKRRSGATTCSPSNRRDDRTRYRSLQPANVSCRPTSSPDDGSRLVAVASLREDELQVLRGMIGRELLSVDYEESRDVESACLRFASELIEIAAIAWQDLTASGVPALRDHSVA